MTDAQRIAPAASASRNWRQSIRLIPARTAASTRRTATKRPKNTTILPWRKNRYWPILILSGRQADAAAVAPQESVTELATDPVAYIVTEHGTHRGGSHHRRDAVAMVSRIERGQHEHALAGQGKPHTLQGNDDTDRQ